MGLAPLRMNRSQKLAAAERQRVRDEPERAGRVAESSTPGVPPIFMIAFLDGTARASGWAGVFVGTLYLVGGRHDLAIACMLLALASWLAHRTLTRSSSYSS
jgi:hypothetical protein